MEHQSCGFIKIVLNDFKNNIVIKDLYDKNKFDNKYIKKSRQKS